jgi:hypothetical protein
MFQRGVPELIYLFLSKKKHTHAIIDTHNGRKKNQKLKNRNELYVKMKTCSIYMYLNACGSYSALFIAKSLSPINLTFFFCFFVFKTTGLSFNGNDEYDSMMIISSPLPLSSSFAGVPDLVISYFIQS